MTDFSDDEVVSAVLDGEATDEEVARVDADAALSARLAELRSARDAIAEPVQLPSARQRDAAITTAMAEMAAVGSEPATTRQVVDLRQRRHRRALRVASIAAAVLILVAMVGAIAALSGRDNRQASNAAGQASSAAALPAAGAADSLASAAAGAPAPSGPASELGSFQTPEGLVDAVRHLQQSSATFSQEEKSQRDTASAAPSAAEGSCQPRADATFVASALLSGQPVIVIVSGRPGQQTVEVDDVNCTVLFTQAL
ncbi:MAG TPA: hypothetical protein VHI95_18915 [Acidimicrobiales bacterium]|jgi:hypothetical protein|nr:hypothetical protein [Acidimicrobiales bacterium]